MLAADDMARLEATVETPLTYDYHGYTVAKCGAVVPRPGAAAAAGPAQGFDVAAMDPAGADFVHIVTECAKLAFADREAWYGDPNFVDVPMDDLLSDAYSDARRKPGRARGVARALLGAPGDPRAAPA